MSKGVLGILRGYSARGLHSGPVKVPWTFVLKTVWQQQTAILWKDKHRPLRYGTALLFAGISWYVAYDYFTDRIDRSSLLVRQTLFNIKCNERLSNLLGSGININSRLSGIQSQHKAFADIQFTVVGSEGRPALVHVIAERKGWDWNTQFLQITPQNMTPILLHGNLDNKTK